MSRVINKVVLSEAEESKVIRRYAQLEHAIKPADKCSIGVGYNTCMDIGFRAVDLFQAIQPEIEEIEKEGKIKPYVHAKINDLRKFIETFLYYFSNGANAERSCVILIYHSLSIIGFERTVFTAFRHHSAPCAPTQPHLRYRRPLLSLGPPRLERRLSCLHRSPAPPLLPILSPPLLRSSCSVPQVALA